MTPHDEILLHAGLDGELDVPASLELQRRLARDPALRAAFDAQMALRDAIRGAATLHAAPAALRARVERAIAGAPPPAAAAAQRGSRRRSWLLAGGSALAASLLTSAMLLQPWSRGDGPWPAAAAEVVAAHARAAMSGHLVEVASSDRHQVRPWLATHLSFAPPVPDLSAQGFELLGGRRDTIGSETAAVLVYRRRQHLISAFVLPRDSERGPRSQVVRGFNVVRQAHAGLGLWIVSDLNASELGDFAALMRAP